MKEITTTYRVKFNGKISEYTETREAESVRDAHYAIMLAWYGVEAIEFLKDSEYEVAPRITREQFFELVEDCNYHFIGLNSIYYAVEQGWITEEQGHEMACVVLHC